MDLQRILFVAAVGLLGFMGWRAMTPKSTFAADGLDPRWDRAVELSEATQRPGLVLFTADWCPACRHLHDTVLSRSDVRRVINEKYTFITIDMTDPSPPAMQRADTCDVNAYPTLIRYDADGRESARTHLKTPAGMIAWLGG